jgi:hypothetical protein
VNVQLATIPNKKEVLKNIYLIDSNHCQPRWALISTKLCRHHTCNDGQIIELTSKTTTSSPATSNNNTLKINGWPTDMTALNNSQQMKKWLPKGLFLRGTKHITGV